MPITDEILTPADPQAETLPDEAAAGPVTGVLYSAPSPPFVYVWYPEAPGNWAPEEITEGPEEDLGLWWLCHPLKLPRTPGQNGHRTPNEADPDAATELARSKVRKDGGIWLDPKAPYSYVARRAVVHPTTGKPGVIHFETFATPLLARKGKRIEYRFDRQSYLRFLLRAQRDGVQGIPAAPPEGVQDLHRARVADRVSRAERRTDLDPAEQAKEVAKNQALAERYAQADVLAPVVAEAPKLGRRKKAVGFAPPAVG